MKTIYTLLLTLGIISTITACKKDSIPKPPVADLELNMYDIKIAGDSTNYEFNYPSTIILKGDYTWTTDVGGAKSYGTYTWTSTSDQQADVTFTITQWTDFTPNLTLSDKFKFVIQTVNYCSFSLATSPYLPFCHFQDRDFSNTWLRTYP